MDFRGCVSRVTRVRCGGFGEVVFSCRIVIFEVSDEGFDTKGLGAEWIDRYVDVLGRFSFSIVRGWSFDLDLLGVWYMVGMCLWFTSLGCGCVRSARTVSLGGEFAGGPVEVRVTDT